MLSIDVRSLAAADVPQGFPELVPPLGTIAFRLTLTAGLCACRQAAVTAPAMSENQKGAARPRSAPFCESTNGEHRIPDTTCQDLCASDFRGKSVSSGRAIS
jgi:hypothetical protein